eukprot:TRINITY_DN34661_c0_g1_i1.p1 TRINITY_DN34661_c0_g1~~TRINITY_DN34661_c0_g1_i1.p1  ORF type:complete len:313 (+),score=85.49 TRINITY_DN34661_c0_g1_i1:43-981(+)
MNVCFLGVGKMGAGMCLRLAETGHAVMAWNRTVSRATDMRDSSSHKDLITVGSSLADALAWKADAADTAPPIVGILGTMSDIEELITRADTEVPGTWKGRTFVNLTSGNPDDGRRVGQLLQEKGLGLYIDACYSGAPAKARSGTGTLFLSAADKAAADVVIDGLLKDIGVPMWAGPIGASRALDYAVVDIALSVFMSWSANASMLEKEGVPHALVMQCMEQRFAAMPAVLSLLNGRMGDRSDEAYANAPVATVDTWLNFTSSRLPYFKDNDMSTVVPDFISGLLQRISADGHGGDDMTRLQELTRYTDKHRK